MDEKQKKKAQQTTATQAQTPPSFEEALARLESIVDSMESGDTPLDELLLKFEEGTKMLRLCESRLKDAEMRIEMLKKNKAGDDDFAPFVPSADSR